MYMRNTHRYKCKTIMQNVQDDKLRAVSILRARTVTFYQLSVQQNELRLSACNKPNNFTCILYLHNFHGHMFTFHENISRFNIFLLGRRK